MHSDSWSLVVTRGHSWSLVVTRGLLVVTRGHSWSLVVTRGHSCVLLDTTQIKKTVNTENIPGMCVLSNHMRDLVTAENEYVLSHGIELFRKTTRFNLHQQEPIRSAIPFYLTAPRTTQAKIGLSAFFSTKRRNDQCFRHFK